MRSLVGSTPALFRPPCSSGDRHPEGHATMHETFRGAVPDGLLYDTIHDMRVRKERDEVMIGASAFVKRALNFIVGDSGFLIQPGGTITQR